MHQLVIKVLNEIIMLPHLQHRQHSALLAAVSYTPVLGKRQIFTQILGVQNVISFQIQVFLVYILLFSHFVLQRTKISLVSRAVFLNLRAAARYRALASIIPGRERFMKLH